MTSQQEKDMEIKRQFYETFLKSLVTQMRATGFTVRVENHPVEVGSPTTTPFIEVRPSRGYY